MEIRKFLWQSGKFQKDLGIKEVSIVNLAMGGKLAWRIISRKNDWWMQVYVIKYFLVKGEPNRNSKSYQGRYPYLESNLCCYFVNQIDAQFNS